MSTVDATQQMMMPQGGEYDHCAVQFGEVQAVAGEDEYSSFFGDESPAGKACPADQVALNNSQQLLDNNVGGVQRAGKFAAPMVTQLNAGMRKTSDSSGSDTTPLAQLHGLLLQQPNPQPPNADHKSLEATHAANQASQQSWLHLQSLLASMPPPAHPQGQVNSPRMHHLMAQGHHAAQGGHQPSQPAPSTHLRDGEAATPSQVVAALSEYMARPNRPKPPTGCAADAVKLFVGNIPKHCTEAVLHKVFQCYGVIVEIAVTRNRHSAESKGSAFVWYSTCMEAARAILSLHSRYTFPDAKGDHVRLVTVRPAVKTPKPQAAPLFSSYDSRAAAKHAAVNVVNYVSGVAGGGLPPGVPSQHTASLQQHLGQWMYHQQQGAAAAAAAAAVSAASMHPSQAGGAVPPIGMSMNPAPGGYANMSQSMHGGSGFMSPQGMPSSHRSSGSGLKDSPRGQMHGPMYRGGTMGQQMQGGQAAGMPMSAGMATGANTATAAAIAAASAAQANRPQQMMHGGGWGQQGMHVMPGAAGAMDGGYAGNGAGPQGVSVDQQAYILQAMANMQIAMSHGSQGGMPSGALDDVRQGSGGLGAHSGSAGTPMMNRASATGSGNSTSGHFDAPGQSGQDHSGWQ